MKHLGESPTKSIYELVKGEVNMPEGLMFRGKYVAKTRNRPVSIRGNREPKKKDSTLKRFVQHMNIMNDDDCASNIKSTFSKS